MVLRTRAGYYHAARHRAGTISGGPARRIAIGLDTIRPIMAARARTPVRGAARPTVPSALRRRRITWQVCSSRKTWRNSSPTPTIPLAGEAAHGAHAGGQLKRTLTAFNLTMLGIGAIIGAGIFSLTGTASANYAGPGIVYSFMIGGVLCALAGRLLRRNGVDDPGRGLGLRLQLRDDGRVHRLDHRLGPDPRVRVRRGDGQHLLVRLLPEPDAQDARHPRLGHDAALHQGPVGAGPAQRRRDAGATACGTSPRRSSA